MDPRRHGLVLVLGLVTATVAAFVALRPREPAYDGKTLSEWVKIAGHETGVARERADRAILKMGTNALPPCSKCCVQKILKHVHDPDEGVRQTVAVALRRIGPDPAAHVDPEAAAEAGLK